MIESKQSKPYVAIRVIEAVKNSNPPGPFLVKYPGGYLECFEDRAREKAKQALREGAAKMRKLGSVAKSGESEASDMQSNNMECRESYVRMRDCAMRLNISTILNILISSNLPTKNKTMSLDLPAKISKKKNRMRKPFDS
jgi:hypothetical protein